ncbi:MAG: hypothetical protein GX129_06550 [Clostridiales bacterium]|jgi:hypothetical protein|nr:hypothetical protein [Clostridiales bacterium]
MMGFSMAGLILIFVQVFSIALMVLGAYALILIIKALQIYIRKNGGY